MMNCKQATKLLSDSKERKLSIAERASLSMHTAMCSGCRNFGKHLGIISELSREFVKGQSGNKEES